MKRQTSELCALIGIDKPSGMTSHDVVNRVRRLLGERRVGHAGTLDPAATGVMLVGVGPATRLMQFLSAERKTYVAQIAFGTQTSTDDAEGEAVASAAVSTQLQNPDYARAALQRLLGKQLQVPPAYSAISQDGVRAYKLARSGAEVELEPRPITVYAAELLSVHTLDGQLVWDVVFSVSKGTYIRALARDLGRQCATFAHLRALRRTASGATLLSHCTTLEALEELQQTRQPFAVSANGVAAQGAAQRLAPVLPENLAPFVLDPIQVLGCAYRVLTPSEEALRLTGAHLPLGQISYSEALTAQQPTGNVALVYNQSVVGIWQIQGSELVCKVNLPKGVMGAQQVRDAKSSQAPQQKH